MNWQLRLAISHPSFCRSHEIIRIDRETELLGVGLDEEKVLARHRPITVQLYFRRTSQVQPTGGRIHHFRSPSRPSNDRPYTMY